MNTPRTVGCKVDGCDSPHRSMGMCNIHYQRWHRTGSTALAPRGIPDARATRKPSGRGRGGVEDAIKVYESIIGTPTLEQWKRNREQERAAVHVVRPQPHGHGADVA